MYSKRKLPGTHNLYMGKVWSPPRNHGSMLLGDKFIGTYISSQIQKLKYSNNY